MEIDTPSVKVLRDIPLGEPRPINPRTALQQEHEDRLRASGVLLFSAKLHARELDVLRQAEAAGLAPSRRGALSVAVELLRRYMATDKETRAAVRSIRQWWGIKTDDEATALAVRWLDAHTRAHNLQKVEIPDVTDGSAP